MEWINAAMQMLISGSKPDYIAGIESRGFISESALAFKLGIDFIPIRKQTNYR